MNLQGERFQLPSDIYRGLDPTAVEDWTFLRQQPAEALPPIRAADKLLEAYMQRLVWEGNRLQSLGRPLEARRAFETVHVWQTIRASATSQLHLNIAMEGEKSLDALLRSEPAPESSWVHPGPDTVWKYWDRGVTPAAGWTALQFDDSAWPEGPASLGYDRNDLQNFSTPLSNTVAENLPDAEGESRNLRACYFRHGFSLSQEAINALEPRSVLQILLWCDDGALVYLNGREVVRDAMPPGPLTAETLAISNAAEAGGKALLRRHRIPISTLKAGWNVIAAQVHQVNAGSSDLAFDLSLGPESSLFSEAGEGISRNDLDTILDEIETILPLAYGEAWMPHARFAFLDHDEALSHPTLAENAEAWIQRGRLQFLLYDWTSALAAVDRSLTLMQPGAEGEDAAPRIKRQHDFRERLFQYQPKR